ncbi:MAG: carboxypeptidase M32 [Planctomycetota bacterium]|nr:carboxypeptidase M32 [Planctomycetota bacterium]
MAKAAYEELCAHSKKTFVLSSAASVLSWDQETGMPPGGGDLRALQLAELAALSHERATDPRIDAWLKVCEQDAAMRSDLFLHANLRGMRRDYDRATLLPESLVRELAATESRAQKAWAQARADSNYAGFQPWLTRMLELQRLKADCLKSSGQSRWDALADLYEPGMNAADLRALFTPLRKRLVELRAKLDARGRKPDESLAKVEFEVPRQEAFVRAVLSAMTFDFTRGRLDRSAHPFCCGTLDDVRLTTRFHKDNVLDALGSTMHEGGHGLYEQGLDKDHQGTPLAEAVSLGIHESQSRLWENHVGKSRAFWQWCKQNAMRELGPLAVPFDADMIYRTANVVSPSLIRVEADEATYDLHVMVRFELETALLHGDLDVKDLPLQWNRLYLDYLGVEVPDDRRGCLQDVHWSCGLFGYFPTYTLGNLYAAQFAAAARRAIPDFDDQLARGAFADLREWLRSNIHQHGRRYTPSELCQRVTSAPLSSEAFLSYLEAKLCAVYEI